MFEVGERQSRPTGERVLVSDNIESCSKLRDIQLCFKRAISFVEGELLNVQEMRVWFGQPSGSIFILLEQKSSFMEYYRRYPVC